MRPFIIAEVGSNWRKPKDEDSFDACADAIKEAKLVGADAVKFQLFTADTLYSISRNRDAFASTKYNELNTEWIPYLAQLANSVGIELWASVFSTHLLDYCHDLDAVKIASGDFMNLELVSATNDFAIKNGKRFCISTGGATETEVASVLDVVDFKEDAIFMHSVPLYPLENHAVNMKHGMMSLYRSLEAFGIGAALGYSDHSMNSIPAQLSVALGAEFIEHHFMLDGTPDISPDYGASFNPSSMRKYISDITDASVVLGGVAMSPQEVDEVQYIRRGFDGLRPEDKESE